MQSSEQNNQTQGFTANFGDDKTEDVDFFNMNSTDQLADGIDLMNVGKNPSNLDLLSGEGGADSDIDMFGGDSGSKSSDNTFDPFQSFGNKQKQNAPPVTVTEPKNDFNSFDPFANFNGNSSNGNVGSSQANDSGGDLMGDWSSFVTNANSSPNISRNSSSSNLQGGGGGIPYSGSGTFQQMGSGSNIPRNNSGSFQPMGGMSRENSGTFQGMQSSIPRNNSGTFQSMGQNQQGFGAKGSAAKPADPFADLGKLLQFL